MAQGDHRSVEALQDPVVDRFRAEVLPCLVEALDPVAVIAFGSRVRGEALRHSDLDVVLVSDAFRDVDWLDRPVRVHEACEIRMGLEFLCYTAAEFQRKREELGIVQAAVEEGVDLLAAE